MYDTQVPEKQGFGREHVDGSSQSPDSSVHPFLGHRQDILFEDYVLVVVFSGLCLIFREHGAWINQKLWILPLDSQGMAQRTLTI